MLIKTLSQEEEAEGTGIRRETGPATAKRPSALQHICLVRLFPQTGPETLPLCLRCCSCVSCVCFPMTSYMYNPSKQVSKVLEEYLEFDAEQLKLGIWSGRLSLKDVNLKTDAIYPHLNHFFAESEANNSEFTKSQPPVRLKLVSGTIGELNLNIPWTSLVWGQGDVQVELRNVVIVLALEGLEETKERARNKVAAAATANEDPSESSGTGSEAHPDATTTQASSREEAATKARKRYHKQKVLREAERRQLQGRDIASWLERLYQKVEEERQREALATGDSLLVAQEGRLRTWLKGATSGFFWRFYAGLQMKLENLKIIMVQDSIELGLIIPSIQMTAGGTKNQEPTDHPAAPNSRVNKSTRTSSSSYRQDEDNSGSSSRIIRNVAESPLPPQNMKYESPDEDGEHVDKHIRILGLGVYVRRISNAFKKKILGETNQPAGATERLMAGDNTLWVGEQASLLQISDISTKEYLLRPTELNVSYSLFYPYPPEKRKKKKQASSSSIRGGTAANALDSSTAGTETVASSSMALSVSSQSTGSKRRRGKREKASVATTDSTKTPSTEPNTLATGGGGSTHGGEGGNAKKLKHSMSSPQTQQRKMLSPNPRKTGMVMRRMSIQNISRQALPSAPDLSSLQPPNDKSLNTESTTSLEPFTADTSCPVPPNLQRMGSDRSSITNNNGQPPVETESTGTQPQSGASAESARPRFARRSSIAGPLKGSTAAAAVVSRVPKPDLVSQKKSVPLARPDDIAPGFSVATRRESNHDMTARLDGNVKVGPLEVVLSTRHYNLIDNLFSACARMRNGRPARTVASVLEDAPVRHSVVLTSNELARATSVTTEAAATVHLGLNAPLNDRSRVVRSWWRYGLYAIRWEIQQRRKVRKHFQDKYLSFSWEQQQRRRKEYVSLYIAAKLLSPEEDGSKATDSSVMETLLLIEDELPIEQVLLYRSIARILHVGGMKEMPDSLVGIRTSSGYRGRALSDDMSQPLERSSRNRTSTGHSSDEGFERNLGHNRTLLSFLEETCEITRLRKERRQSEVLPRHRQMSRFPAMDRKSPVEEATFAMTLDTKTDRRTGGGFSRTTPRRKSGHHRSSSTEDGAVDTSMKFSFSGSMEKVELMVVEEEVQYENDGRTKNLDEDSSGKSSMSVSDLSALTEEDRLSDGGAMPPTGMEDESASDPILASTDFLLFRQPEKVLLRTVIRRVDCSAFAQGSGSRSFNFNISRIEALSGTDVKLLHVGNDEEAFGGSDSAVGYQVPMMDPDDPIVPRSALSLSLVFHKDQQVAQCDVATVRTTFDPESISGLLSFGVSSRSPRPLMPSTPGESVRMYVVNQNVGTAYRFFDASFRLHGIEVMLRKEPAGEGSMEVDMGMDDSETRAIFVADMVEVYSGKAANKLGMGKPQWHDTYTATRLSVLGENDTRPDRTRSLRMLDVEELISSKSAFLSFNVVSQFSASVERTRLSYSLTYMVC